MLVWVATALVWAMLLAAPRSVVELQVQRRRGQGRGADGRTPPAQLQLQALAAA